MHTSTATRPDRPVRLPQDRLRPRPRIDVLIRTLDRALSRRRMAIA